MRWRPTVNGEAILVRQAPIADNVTRWFRPATFWGTIADGSATTADITRSMAPSVPIVVKNMRVASEFAPGSGKSRTLSLYHGAAVSALSATIADSATTATDNDVVSVAAGERIWWHATATNVPDPAGHLKFSAVVVAQ
jgi:hypothetical protein